VYPIRDSGESHGILLIGNDVTQQRLLEQQLNQAQKLESIGQLAAGVAHEINTPMQYIGDNVSYLKGTVTKLLPLLECVHKHVSDSPTEGDFSAAVHSAAEGIKLDRILLGLPSVFNDLDEGITHITQIVRAMKEFAHPGSEAPQPVDVNHALQSTIVVAKNEWKYVAEVDTDLDPSLPMVDGYPHELNQVFLNLLINAAHAIGSVAPEGKKGRISLTTRLQDEGVIVEIRDTGGGIPAGIHDRVFDPFFTTKEVGKGTGQGLAIAHRVVVLQHKGRLWFDSEEGVGTTFYIWLPHSK
jgi:signal transduction histidine kinase